MTKKKSILFIFAVMIVLLAILSQTSARKKGIRLYEEFNSREITGELLRISSSAGTTYFTIQDSASSKYGFWPIINEENGKKYIFSNIAEVGDSVSKPSYGESLYLFKKDGRVIEFKFREFN